MNSEERDDMNEQVHESNDPSTAATSTNVKHGYWRSKTKSKTFNSKGGRLTPKKKSSVLFYRKNV